tara:strand:- start:1798 stop:2316 length:519 start_codon:yes stop_codon:yes gene_type:complete
MNIDDLYPSKYLDASDLMDGENGYKEFILTIQEMRVDDLPVMGKHGPTGDEEPKGVLVFAGAKKGLILSPFNVKIIKHLYGAETDAWGGKRVTVFVEQGVKAFGKSFDVVRIRPNAPAPKVTQGNVEQTTDVEQAPQEPEKSVQEQSEALWGKDDIEPGPGGKDDLGDDLPF